MNRMAGLNALWIDLLEQEKLNSTLRKRNAHQMEQQTQQESDKVNTTIQPKFSKNVENGLVASKNTTAIPGTQHEHRQQRDDERSDEDILKVSSDNTGPAAQLNGSPSPPNEQPLLIRKSSETFFKTTRDGRGGSTTHSCAECGRTFRYKSQLIHHWATHTGEKPYKCGECGAAYTQKPSLIRHQVIHSDVRPYGCSVCNRTFSRKDHLTSHQSIHTNEKPFTCDICSQSFRLKNYLSDHMNMHSGRKPRKCNACGRGFSNWAALYKHLKDHLVV